MTKILQLLHTDILSYRHLINIKFMAIFMKLIVVGEAVVKSWG